MTITDNAVTQSSQMIPTSPMKADSTSPQRSLMKSSMVSDASYTEPQVNGNFQLTNILFIFIITFN
jgi:hypothetical protein